MNHADAIKTLTEYFEDEGWCQRTSEAVAELQQSHSDEAYKALQQRLEAAEQYNSKYARLIELEREGHRVHALELDRQLTALMEKHVGLLACNTKLLDDLAEERKNWIRTTARELMVQYRKNEDMDWDYAWNTARYGWTCKPEDC